MMPYKTFIVPHFLFKEREMAKVLSQYHLLNNLSFFTDLKCHPHPTPDSLKYLDLLKILFCSIHLSAYGDILEVNTFMKL